MRIDDDYVFKEVDNVEIMRQPGSYYKAVVLDKVDANRFRVKYESLFTDKKSRTMPYTEVVHRSIMRLRDPILAPLWRYDEGSKVDAFVNDAWREGVIIANLGCVFHVRLRYDRGEIYSTTIRPHLDDDDDDDNIPSSPESSRVGDNGSTTSNSSTKSGESTITSTTTFSSTRNYQSNSP